MQLGDSVKDLTGDFELGEIIDIYTNRHGDHPVIMYTVDFGDDNVFDRLFHEISA